MEPETASPCRADLGKVNDAPSHEAIAAAKNADAVIAVVGITSQLEGEEMPVSEPGFLGGDRTSIDLPQPEEELVEAVAATGKPLAVVLMNGSALAVNWINEHANAILEAWYPGEEGGAAVAETLSGKNNPAGRLPVTFYTGVSQLPNFEDYGMANRTYRYFDDKPLYPFGYGLSYTTFKYSDLSVPGSGGSGSACECRCDSHQHRQNRGRRSCAGLSQVPCGERCTAHRSSRISAHSSRTGASQKVHFDLKDRDLGIVTEDGTPIVAQGDYTISIGGGQPDTGAPVATGKFHIQGQIALPE